MMIFIDPSSQSAKEGLEEQDKERQLRRWLTGCFYLSAMPLERRYIDLLYQQIALLNSYLSSSSLTLEQSNELSDWINQLQRIINSHAFIDQLENVTADGEIACKMSLENSLWPLFGADSQEEIERNIDKFCRDREQKISQIEDILATMTSLPMLETYLKRRRKREKHIARFIEEPCHYD